MKSVISVNTVIPTLDDFVEYDSGESLQDYDIILFDPRLPYYSREHFTAGGSCISVDASTTAQGSVRHWTTELRDALKEGKSIFFLLNEIETDSVAMGSTYAKGSRTFQTGSINNYAVLPADIGARNSKGSKIVLSDSRLAGLFGALESVMSYKVILGKDVGSTLFTTKNGVNPLGAIVSIDDLPGHLVLLPYFNLTELTELDDDDEAVWSKEAVQLSSALVKQLVEIDKILRQGAEITPAPAWVESKAQPKEVTETEKRIKKITQNIEKLQTEKSEELAAKEALQRYSSLLYETGTPLELVVEDSLRLIGYEVANYRSGNIEIDHVISGPSGLRMIGETEGKDKSAIGITKFRQLESNIGEDFERDEITVPAKGILFGNAFRFTDPDKRDEQFTDKCITNAKRLGTALVSTSDLYPIVVYILDNPDDAEFKTSCRNALESTVGDKVTFPDIPQTFAELKSDAIKSNS